MDILNRFLNYVSFETTSNEKSDERPSNPLELNLLNFLNDELKSMGVSAFIKDGFVYAKIKSDCKKKDSIFLMAHVDTSPDASGKNPKPRVVHYDGTPIELSKGKILSSDVFDNLNNHLDHDLVVTDGNTLLGADDKAGIAIIMDVTEKLLKRGNYPNMIICFSPDEEIGRGADSFDMDWCLDGENKIYAYTVDGGDIRGFSYENFNAASAKVIINGVSVHPGSAKNKMINALEVIQEFHSLLPACKPENTEKREGFIHIGEMTGQVEKAESNYILRSFDKDELESFKEAFINVKNKINSKYRTDTCDVIIKDSYENMKEIIDKYPYSVDLVHKVYKEMGIPLYDEPIRGGTDGARLSFMGLPCPNIGNGGENFHGVYEYLDLDQMKKMTEIVINMIDKIE